MDCLDHLNGPKCVCMCVLCACVLVGGCLYVYVHYVLVFMQLTGHVKVADGQKLSLPKC